MARYSEVEALEYLDAPRRFNILASKTIVYTKLNISMKALNFSVTMYSEFKNNDGILPSRGARGQQGSNAHKK